MKEKVIIFIVGLLMGAIISTGSIYIYTVANSSSNNNQNNQMMGGNPPSLPNGQNFGNGQPPEMNNNIQNNNQTNN